MTHRFLHRGFFTAAALAVSTFFGVPHASAGEAFSFGLWGDMPYAKNNDQPKMDALLDSLNAADIAFSLYDGDIKDGGSKCTDTIFTDAADMFNALKAPVVYVPGDNEWTDCHRTNNGGYDNLERLAQLRKMMFAAPESFGQKKMAVDHQGPLGGTFSENTRFVHGGIVFVGLNMPGSNNNKVNSEKACSKKSKRTPEQCAADNAEYVERDAANIAWVDEAFHIAAKDKAAGVVLVFQADPVFDIPETDDVDERASTQNADGYTAFLDAVSKHAKSYAGQILLVHGDTHFFKFDKPMLRQADLLTNVSRIETFGSPNIHWVKVGVDVTSPEVFTVRPVIVPGN